METKCLASDTNNSCINNIFVFSKKNLPKEKKQSCNKKTKKKDLKPKLEASLRLVGMTRLELVTSTMST